VIERTPEDVLAGILRISVGGQERIVPTLPIAATREWQATLGHGPDGYVAPEDESDWTPEQVDEFTALSLEAVVDLVAGYDRTSALGGKEWLLANADPFQLYQAARQMMAVAYPFVANPDLFLRALLLAPARSSPPNSTNGASPIGDSIPERLSSASTKAS